MSATWQWAKANPDAAARRIRELERENGALRKDKERLDYLEKSIDFIGWRFYGKPCHFDLRSTIDGKRKEIQT